VSLIRILDFKHKYKYSHKNPFPVPEKEKGFIDFSFKNTFKLAGSFFPESTD